VELSLHSGGEYEVFLLVDVKDKSFNLAEDEVVGRLKEEYIPPEFHHMTIFFDEHMLEEWYPEIDEHR
jgi:hypothetical protein